MIYNWDNDKNQRLKKERRISFEEIILAIDNGQLLDVLSHPNPEKYGNQRLYLVALEDYVVVVPFRKEGDEIYLITAFPSRRYTKRYFGKEDQS
ncbi:MAG TPA: BrnT family toxin [bacterium]|nr:BrnT family toxin [bacterium]